MPLFTWDDSYSVKINLIDEHHKKLIDIINSLHEAMIVGKSNEVLVKILYELLDYTNFHFGVEEKNMEKLKYPEYQNHKAKHDEFIKKIIDLKKQFDFGTVSLSISLKNFLKDWLINHIKKEDRKYISCFIENGIDS